MKKVLFFALVLVMVFAISMSVYAAPADKGPTAIDVPGVALDAYVVKDKGNTNTLYITVGDVTETFVIANNAKAVYEVDGYGVFVGTYGNVKISELYFVSAPEVEEDCIVGYRTEEKIEIEKVSVAAIYEKIKPKGAPNYNILTIIATEEGTLTTTTFAIWSSGLETIFDIAIADYQNIILNDFTVDNGTFADTYSVGDYAVYVRIQGNAVASFYLID